MRGTIAYFASRISLCLIAFSVVAYLSIDQQNELIELRREIPLLEKEVKSLSEENRALKFAVDKFLDPHHLLQLLREPEYRHLRFPSSDEVVVIQLYHPLEGGIGAGEG